MTWRGLKKKKKKGKKEKKKDETSMGTYEEYARYETSISLTILCLIYLLPNKKGETDRQDQVCLSVCVCVCVSRG